MKVNKLTLIQLKEEIRRIKKLCPGSKYHQHLLERFNYLKEGEKK